MFRNPYWGAALQQAGARAVRNRSQKRRVQGRRRKHTQRRQAAGETEQGFQRGGQTREAWWGKTHKKYQRNTDYKTPPRNTCDFLGCPQVNAGMLCSVASA